MSLQKMKKAELLAHCEKLGVELGLLKQELARLQEELRCREVAEQKKAATAKQTSNEWYVLVGGQKIPAAEYRRQRDEAFRLKHRFDRTFGNTVYVSRVDGTQAMWRHRQGGKWMPICEQTFVAESAH